MSRARIVAVFAFLILIGAPFQVRSQSATTLEISLRNHRFQPSELRAPAGRALELRVINTDPTPAEFESRMLRVEKVVAGNASITIPLQPLQPGRYRFFDDFHEATAEGFLVIE
jgi:Cupredoxin-like domain